MSISWTTNTTPATGSAAMYSLIAQLVAQGWVKKADSDGTTYSATGVQVTGGNAGANGLANSLAWVRMQSPGGAGTIELIIQRASASNQQWRMKVSLFAGFTGGTPGATQTPSATDEYLFWGSGTDAAPGFTTLFGGADGTYRYNCGADSAAPYGFWSGAFPSGGGAANHAFALDPLTNMNPTDGGKYYIHVSTGAAFKNGGLANTTLGPTSQQSISTTPKVSPVAADWLPFPAWSYYINPASSLCVPGGVPTDPISSSDLGFPIPCGRSTGLATPNYKGLLSVMKWVGVTRAVGDAFTLSTTRDRICLGDVSVPWDGSIPTV